MARVFVRSVSESGFYTPNEFWPFSGREAEVDEQTLEMLEGVRNLNVRRLSDGEDGLAAAGEYELKVAQDAITTLKGENAALKAQILELEKPPGKK